LSHKLIDLGYFNVDLRSFPDEGAPMEGEDDAPEFSSGMPNEAAM
jgi:hypothetical protein